MAYADRVQCPKEMSEKCRPPLQRGATRVRSPPALNEAYLQTGLLMAPCRCFSFKVQRVSLVDWQKVPRPVAADYAAADEFDRIADLRRTVAPASSGLQWV